MILIVMLCMCWFLKVKDAFQVYVKSCGGAGPARACRNSKGRLVVYWLCVELFLRVACMCARN